MPTRESFRKILVVQPSWVGDAVMATPALRAIRARFPESRISYLLRRYVKPIYNGMPWADQIITYRTGKQVGLTGRGSVFDLAKRLGGAEFDLAILLPNSFKTALICKLAGIPRVLGYERDGRGFLLSDKLQPGPKQNGQFIPSPIIDYYMALAQYLGCDDRDKSMELFITPAERAEADAVLARLGIETGERPAAQGRGPRVILNPGAQYGAAKCWLPEYFAQLADRLIDERGATVLLSSSPKERAIIDAISRHMKHPPLDLARAGQTLGSLKEIIRRCDLMITNDTGPRHIAAALSVPVVTIFGPTHPEWTEINFAAERKVAVKVFCGPCQKKICPLDHRCMTLVTPAMVFATAMELLGMNRAAPASPAALVS
jgi:heptosyltransferase-2